VTAICAKRTAFGPLADALASVSLNFSP
jgi:hypothetical protein